MSSLWLVTQFEVQRSFQQASLKTNGTSHGHGALSLFVFTARTEATCICLEEMIGSEERLNPLNGGCALCS